MCCSYLILKIIYFSLSYKVPPEQKLPAQNIDKEKLISESFERRFKNLQKLYDTDQDNLRQNDVIIKSLNEEILAAGEKLALLESTVLFEGENKVRYLEENETLRAMLAEQANVVAERDAAQKELLQLKMFHQHHEDFEAHLQSAMTDGLGIDEELLPWTDSITGLSAGQSLQICLMTYVRLPVQEQGIFYTEAFSRLQNKALLGDLERKLQFMVNITLLCLICLLYYSRLQRETNAVQDNLPVAPNGPGPAPPGPPMPAKPTAALPANLDMSGIAQIEAPTNDGLLYSSTPTGKKRKASEIQLDTSYFSEFDSSFSQSSLLNVTLINDKMHKVVNDLNLKSFNPEGTKIKSYYNEVCGAQNEAISFGFEIFIPSSPRATKVNRSVELLRCGLTACKKAIRIGQQYSECVILYPEFHPYCTLDLKEIPLSHGNGLAICPTHAPLSRRPELLYETNRKVRHLVVLHVLNFNLLVVGLHQCRRLRPWPAVQQCRQETTPGPRPQGEG